MINTKKLRNAIKLGGIKQVTEILRAAPKGDSLGDEDAPADGEEDFGTQ